MAIQFHTLQKLMNVQCMYTPSQKGCMYTPSLCLFNVLPVQPRTKNFLNLDDFLTQLVENRNSTFQSFLFCLSYCKGVVFKLIGVHIYCIGVVFKLIGVHIYCKGVVFKLIGVHIYCIGVVFKLIGVHIYCIGVVFKLMH